MRFQKITPTVFLFLFLGLTGMAQNRFTISGTVVDSTGAPLPGATVVLLQQKDSVLVSFGITESDGRFEIRRAPADDYLLQITYVGYDTWHRPIALQQSEELGAITLTPVSTLLDEVVVKGEQIPILMKNDTVEYNADAFQVRPQAAVEELLKKLPGVEVDRQGNIRAQGEQVNRVLVDGKEFFGSDPKIATQNLPADAVDKVQVFDKRSEMAEFSGIDDGEREKTINLALKEDKKQGYFGNVTAGYGTDDRYQGKANINRFSKNMQLSAIGMTNNLNQQGFSIDDYLNFMGGLRSMMSGGGGGFRLTLDSDEVGVPLDFGQSTGITTTRAGGLNLNYDFGEKTELSTSYFYNRISNELQQSTYRENLLADAPFTSEEETEQLNRNTNHRLNLTLRHEIDSMQRLSLRSNLGFNDAFFESSRNSQTFGSENVLENTGLNDYFSSGDNFRFSSGLTYLRRFRKHGRVFTADAELTASSDDRLGTLFSENAFLSGDPAASFVDTVSQRQEQINDRLDYGGRVSYTEPIGKSFFLETNYSHQNYGNELRKDFYDIRFADEVFDPDLSRHYQRDYLYDRGGLNLRYNRRNFNLTTGVSLQHSQLKGELIDEDLPIRQSFTNWLPSLRWGYDLTTTRHLNFDYETRVQEPSLEELQPVVDNSDPLNTYTGNPDLRPEYSHDLSLHFMSFDQFTFTNIFALLSATYTSDKITNAQSIDSLFRQNTMPVNVDHDWRLSGYFSFGTPLRFIKSRINLTVNSTYNRGILFVNARENGVDRWNNSFDVSLENRKKEVIDAQVGARWSFNSAHYSEDDGLDQNFFDQTYYADLTLNIGESWSFGSSLDYTQYRGQAFSGTAAVPLWQAQVSKLLWNDRLQLKVTAFDLLNQNQGISRTSQLNYLEERRYNTLGRYVMLSLGYSLSGFGKDSGNHGIQITTRRR